MELLYREFEKTGVYQWVRVVTPKHFQVVNGLDFCNGIFDFLVYDIDFLSDEIDIDQLDNLITQYYSSCSDFFLAATDDDRQKQYQFIAEMIAEQEWEIEPIRSCELFVDVDDIDESQILKIIAKKLSE